MTLREELEMLLNLKKSGGVVTREGYHYLTLEDFVLQEGKEYDELISPKWMKPGEMRYCYQNAFDLVSSYGTSKGLTYCEGYARTEFFAMNHAWCVDSKGRIIDPTWVDRGTAYYGVIMDWRYVFETMLGSGMYGILDNWKQGWPILKKKWKKI